MISYHSLDDGKSDRIMAVDCHPDTTVVTFLTVGGSEVRIWAAGEAKTPPTFCTALTKGHEGSVNCARWCPSGDLLASAGDRGTVCIWKGQKSSEWWRENEPQFSSLPHGDDVYDVAWSPDGLLLTGAIDHVTTLWNVVTRKRVLSVSSEHYVQGVAFDGRSFATQSCDRTLRVYTLEGSKVSTKVIRTWEGGSFASELQHHSFFRRPAFTSRKIIAAAALGDGTSKSGAVAFSRANLQVCDYFPAPDGPAAAVRVAPPLFDDDVFAVAFRDAVAIYSDAKPKPLMLVRGMHRAPLTDVAWANDASMLIVASSDGYLSFLRFDSLADDLGLEITRPLPAIPPSPLPQEETTPEEPQQPVVTTLQPRKKKKPNNPEEAANVVPIDLTTTPDEKSPPKRRIAPTLVTT